MHYLLGPPCKITYVPKQPPICQALRSRKGGRGVVSPPLKFFCRCAFFSKSPGNALFERSNQKCTWKLIFYMSKLKKKHNTLLLIRFYQAENIKSITIFNSLTEKREPKISPPPIQSLFWVFSIKLKLCKNFTKGDRTWLLDA